MPVRSKTEDLEAFIAVVDSGSFSHAAELLDLQVAKVSRAVSRLEKGLNCTLLNRTTRRLELTEEGNVFLEHIRNGLNAIECGEEAIRLLKGTPSGKLRIDAASPFILHQITPLVNDFHQAFPQVVLDITSNDDIIDLLERKTDVAIRIGELGDSNLHARTLGSSTLHMVASPDYLAKNGTLTQLNDLTQHRLIGFSRAPTLNQWPLHTNLDLSFHMYASSGETVRQLCLAGLGICLLSNFMCRKDIQSGRLAEILPGSVVSPNRRESVNAVYYRNSAVSSRIQTFLDFIQPRLSL
ncbi:LysR family transcriptional regulator [Planctobacterium marinum]|uniref:LysR family transcriptional regulator n=1 Tax=Planctobacterium marinum TaxID=1631968 RepID=UPI001E406ECE|nr:LysR family transcriptional regulator [Planctobacterium marinum]MCC2605686.1 LysR family transcriptional regulator [Planctobacterium marinum]